MNRWILVALVLLPFGGCTSRPVMEVPALSSGEIRSIAGEVEAAARASEASWKEVTCENLAPVLRFWDGSPPGLVHSSEGVMKTFSDVEWADQIRSNVCAGSGSGGGESFVDSILVSVLSPEVATATMSYHAVLRDREGRTTDRRGQILRVFRRTPAGWKIRVSMSTHSDLRE